MLRGKWSKPRRRFGLTYSGAKYNGNRCTSQELHEVVVLKPTRLISRLSVFTQKVGFDFMISCRRLIVLPIRESFRFQGDRVQVYQELCEFQQYSCALSPFSFVYFII